MTHFGCDIYSKKDLDKCCEILSKALLNRNNASTFHSMSFDVQNTNLTARFYDIISKYSVKKFSISFSFTGKCLCGKPKFPAQIESLSVISPLSFSRDAILSIANLTTLTDLHLGGYFDISIEISIKFF